LTLKLFTSWKTVLISSVDEGAVFSSLTVGPAGVGCATATSAMLIYDARIEISRADIKKVVCSRG
jgi:hypothetical protein